MHSFGNVWTKMWTSHITDALAAFPLPLSSMCVSAFLFISFLVPLCVADGNWPKNTHQNKGKKSTKRENCIRLLFRFISFGLYFYCSNLSSIWKFTCYSNFSLLFVWLCGFLFAYVFFFKEKQQQTCDCVVCSLVYNLCAIFI